MRGFNVEFLYTKVYELITGDISSGGAIEYFNQTILPILKFLSVTLVLISLIGLLYTLIRTRDIWKEVNKRYAFKKVEAKPEENEKWQRILDLLNSDRPADWRQSIIEADIILDNLVLKMGYVGETLGERLKGVEKSDFQTIDDAWEAHRVRNKIVHEGSDFILTQREAKRIISLFENVLKEFGYLG